MFISFPVSPDLGRHIKELILTGEKSVAPKGSFYCEKKSVTFENHVNFTCVLMKDILGIMYHVGALPWWL